MVRVADPMHLAHIGELLAVDDCWRLVYDGCGHVQVLARVGLEEPRRAETYVRGDFAYCLSCQLKTRAGSAAD